MLRVLMVNNKMVIICQCPLVKSQNINVLNFKVLNSTEVFAIRKKQGNVSQTVIRLTKSECV